MVQASLQEQTKVLELNITAWHEEQLDNVIKRFR